MKSRFITSARAAQQARPAHRDITVVVQGPVMSQHSQLAPDGITATVLQRVRQVLPEATVILSTWAGTDVSGLNADAFIFSDDPGGTRFYPPEARPANPLNNGNRLIVSTRAGLAQVTTRYTLKIRSDLALFHDHFLDYFGRYNAYDPAWHVLKSRILAFPIYSLKFEQRGGATGYRPFHISDWCYFGLTEDLRQLYACPLMPEPETSQWFSTQPRRHPTLWPERWWRYSPEQYVTSQLALHTLGIHLEDGDQNDPLIRQQSDRFIANNFCVLDQWQWGMLSLKLLNTQLTLPDVIYAGLYRHGIWCQDYQLYANGSLPRGSDPLLPRLARQWLKRGATRHPVEMQWEGSLHILNAPDPWAVRWRKLAHHWRNSKVLSE